MSGLTSNLVMSADSRLILTSDYDSDINWITVNRDRLYWSSDPGYGITMTSVPNSSIPAVIDPKTNRILVGQKTGDHETTLYTIEQACLNSACDQSRQEVAKVPYSVNWVNYQPDGSNIVFSEDDGNIYLLSVSTKQVTPVLVDATKKSRPVFSADASELLYLDANRGVNILLLSDKKVLSTGGLQIVSANWIVQPAKTASTPA